MVLRPIKQGEQPPPNSSCRAAEFAAAYPATQHRTVFPFRRILRVGQKRG